MPKFTMVFNANRKGSIGLQSRFSATREAVDKEKAVLALYTDYDHISILTNDEVKEDENPSCT